MRRSLRSALTKVIWRGFDRRPEGIPLFAHALCACRAQIAEAAGDHPEAAAQYADAVDRWREFRRMPELAYALLGLGRCLRRLGDDSAGAFSEARELFSSLGYGPAMTQTKLD